MKNVRRQRVGHSIQETIMVALRTRVEDPRVKDITVTRVELTQDAKQATIFYIVPKEVTQSKEAFKKIEDGLSSVTAYLKRHLAKTLVIHRIPQLLFKHDRGYENSLRVYELLKQIQL